MAGRFDALIVDEGQDVSARDELVDPPRVAAVDGELHGRLEERKAGRTGKSFWLSSKKT